VVFSPGGDGGRRSLEHPAHCAGFATATDCRTIAIYEYTALDRVAQIAEHKYCRPQARPFRLGFPRKVPVFPICPPAALKALRRPRPSTLAAVNLAPAVQHGCRSAGLACPLGSSTAAASSVRHNQGLKARPHALNRFALARKRFIAHF
jgi:hypothetical protein